MNNTEIPFIKDMFDSIASRYDLLNRLLSLRQDVYWRRAMAEAADIPENGKVLDAASGTGDVAIEILRQKGSGVKVFGLDFSPEMLIRAKDKVRKISGIHLIAGNAFHLPFRENSFDAVTIAFGIRNITDKLSVLKAFHKCLKPGGMVLVLELGVPQKKLLLSLYLFYFKKLLPLIGWFFSKNMNAYQYLPESVILFPPPDAFAGIMREAGFSPVKWRKLTLGIANLYAGCKL